jgi:5-methylcytosine-specific restriction endonuclease McrA
MISMFNYGTTRWRKTSLKIRAENGHQCMYCDGGFCVADVVDHICELSDVILTPNYEKHYAFNRANLIPCCHHSHNIKTQFIRDIRKHNSNILAKANDPIIYYDNLPPVIDLKHIKTLKALILTHLKDI